MTTTTEPPDLSERTQQTRTWADRCFSPAPVAPLVWLRVLCGLTFLYWSVSYQVKGLFEFHYVLPRFHFPWPIVGRLPTLDPFWMRALFVTLAACGLCVALGFLYRVAAWGLLLGFGYLFLLDKAFYQNHYYLLTMVAGWLAITSPHVACSVDARWHPALRSRTVPAWQLFAARFLIAIPYTYGAIAKITSDWLAGQPVRMMLAGLDWYPIIGRFFHEEWMVQFFVWGGLLLDLLIVPALLWGPTRLFALVFGLGFHMLNATLFTIGVFPWFMIAATPVLLPASTFRRVIPVPSEDRVMSVAPSPLRNRLVTGCVIGFVVAQLLLPFRHHLYAGPVSWNEAGHYFSWRMKLRGKTSALQVYAVDPQRGESVLVDVRRWLTSFQTNRMARDPQMLHSFAVFLKEEFAQHGAPQVEVHMVVLCSLNGRKPQLLIDPEVDLASVTSWSGRPPFVVPLAEPLRYTAWDEDRRFWGKHLPEPYRK